ncbi:MAG: Hsp20/alpha crystallin family protein [Candidatus Obscuribacterales bacterium]|nr:Hsp20/alpha crystallin family protein [Candidatus Obscuribacterales bacterium]
MSYISKYPESFAVHWAKFGLLILLLALSLFLASGQMLHSYAADSGNTNNITKDKSGEPVRIHSGKSKHDQRPLDLDSTINKMRESASKLSLPSSMFEPWWRTMLHDPDADWLMRNFDVMSSNPDKNWAFPVGLGAYIPRLDTSETADTIEITAEVPGIDEKNLDVTVTDDLVTIKGDKKSETTQKALKDGSGFQAIERAYGSFERTVALPCKVQSENAQASLKNGILTIMIPKKHAPKSEGKKLTIKSE